MRTRTASNRTESPTISASARLDGPGMVRSADQTEISMIGLTLIFRVRNPSVGWTIVWTHPTLDRKTVMVMVLAMLAMTMLIMMASLTLLTTVPWWPILTSSTQIQKVWTNAVMLAITAPTYPTSTRKTLTKMASETPVILTKTMMESSMKMTIVP